jgi:hypothetical protein
MWSEVYRIWSDMARRRSDVSIEAATRHLEELQEIAERLHEVVKRTQAVLPETDEQILGRKPKLSKAMDRVLVIWPLDVSFTATSLAAEIQRRYGAVLRRPVSIRAIAAALRRRRDQGILQEVREGRPFEEAEYRKKG